MAPLPKQAVDSSAAVAGAPAAAGRHAGHSPGRSSGPGPSPGPSPGDVAAGARGGGWLLDGLSVGASLACLVHCLVLPLLLLLLPTMAALLAVPEAFHLWALAFAVPTSIIAMALGYRRHRRRRPWQLGAAGLVLLAAGALLMPSQAAETALTVAGAVLLSFGHVLNWRAARPA